MSAEYVRRGGVWNKVVRGIAHVCSPYEVPAEVKAEELATRQERERVSLALRSERLGRIAFAATTRDYIVESYAPGTCPRLFLMEDGSTGGSGDFVVQFVRRFPDEVERLGIASVYRMVDQVLIDAGHRVKAEETRGILGQGTGSADLPVALRALA